MDTPDVKYYVVELDGELAGMFKSNTLEWAAVEITKLKISYPDVIIKTVNKAEYESLLKLADGNGEAVH